MTLLPVKEEKSKMPSATLAIFKQYFPIFLVLIILIGIGMALSFDTFFSVKNFTNVLRQASIVGIISVGMTFVIISGGIDLSVASNMILASVLAAQFLRHYGNIPAILIALAASTLFGFINGFLIVQFGIAPFVTTLGMMGIGVGLALIYAHANIIIAYTDFFQWLCGGYVFKIIPIPVIVFIVVVIVGLIIEKNTVLGRYIYAIGGNEEAAKLSAINVKKYKLIIYTMCGFLCGLAAIILLARMGSASNEIGKGAELEAIAAVVIGGTSIMGGTGSVGGSVIGIIIMQVVANLLNLLNVPSYTQQAVKGLIIILAIIIYKKQGEIKLGKRRIKQVKEKSQEKP